VNFILAFDGSGAMIVGLQFIGGKYVNPIRGGPGAAAAWSIALENLPGFLRARSDVRLAEVRTF
jgi:hypothetical protein